MTSPSSARALLALGLIASLLVPTSATAQDAAPDPLPEQGTILEPGRYVSAHVGPTIDFRADSGWVVGPSGGGPIFTLEYLAAPGTVLSVTRFDGETFLDSCDPSSMSIVEATVLRKRLHPYDPKIIPDKEPDEMVEEFSRF